MDAHRVEKATSRSTALSDLRLWGAPVTSAEIGQMVPPTVGGTIFGSSLVAWMRMLLRRLQGKPFKTNKAAPYYLENGQLRRDKVPLRMLLDGAANRKDEFWVVGSVQPGAASRHALCFTQHDPKQIEQLSQAGYCVTLIGDRNMTAETADARLIPKTASSPDVLAAQTLTCLPLLQQVAEVLFVHEKGKKSLAGTKLATPACQRVLARSLNGTQREDAGSIDAFLDALDDTQNDAGSSSAAMHASRIKFETQVGARVQPGDLSSADKMSADTRLEHLKVAFFGPWNFDSGLALASRSYARALLRTGAMVNIEPIRTPFGPHAPLSDANGIQTFVGKPDLAIVNLNPDGWNIFLEDDQLSQILQSRFRVGAFIFEGQRLPGAFRQVGRYLDEIWAPTKFVQECFEANIAGNVEVVPYEIPPPFPALSAQDLQQARSQLGLDQTDRVILYAFDAASFLLRKNPEALIQAFDLSRLAEEGWTLVLKTKHILSGDRDGEQLRAMAANCHNCVLVDQSMTERDHHALFQLAEIYASPHASEGFGLTIAEALQLGTPVVATDFGGSRDFLRSETGIPVPADPFCLLNHLGPYERGTIWKAVDPQALAAALRQAAYLSPSERRDLAHRSQVVISENYDIGTITKTMQARLLRAVEAPAGV